MPIANIAPGDGAVDRGGTAQLMATSPLGGYPRTRLRRPRCCPWSRRLLRETTLTVNDLVWPLFIIDGDDRCQPIPSMPGAFRYGINHLVKAAGEALAVGVSAVALFPSIENARKDHTGSYALAPNNLVCRAVKALKRAHPEMGILCDVALDPFTDTGHDGIVRNGAVANDETVSTLAAMAVNQAKAGCDMVGPSDMMDGRVGVIRDSLDAAGFDHVQIISYAAKYASALYGPFRDAVGTTTLKGDKKSYQMDPANANEALREVALDLQEGADAVIVKPGTLYMDVITRVKDTFGRPTWAYQTSGEYAMIKAAAKNGWLDEKRVMIETLTCLKRAGCDVIVTYFAPAAARLLHGAE